MDSVERRTALLLAGTAASALLASLLVLRLVAPASASGDAAAVQAGGSHSCALTSVGGVKCWGENGSGQLGNGTSFDSSLPVIVCETGTFIAGAAPGGAPSSCCLILAGAAPAGVLPPPCAPLSGVSAITTGGAHTCALLDNSTVRCWGENGSGQLGDGTTFDSSLPVVVCGTGPIILGAGPAGIPPPAPCCPVIAGFASAEIRIPLCSPMSGVTAIAAGNAHTCALMADTTVRCWGENGSGQLGDGTTFDSSAPVAVCTPLILSAGAPAGFPCATLTGVVAIAAGGAHTCALLAAGTVRCWGANDSGQLGNGSTFDSSAPVDVCEGGPIIAGISPAITPSSCCPIVLSAGAAGILVCSPLSGVAAITAGGAHTCALLGDSTVRCWGANASGQLGDGTMFNSSFPKEVCQAGPLIAGISPAITPFSCCPIVLGVGPAGILPCTLLSNVAAVDAGGSHTCALMEDSTVRCWGENGSGQLGDGFTFDASSPVNVCQPPFISGAEPAGFLCVLLSSVATISAGDAHTCALMESGAVRCWGANTSGKLGDGTFSNSSFPTDVVGIAPKPTPTPTRTPTAPPATSTAPAGATPTPTVPAGATPTHTPPPGALTATRTPTPPPGAPTATRTPTPPPGALSGDVDCNGRVNPIDAALILQLTAALIRSVPCPANADVNGGGGTNVLDAAIILQYVAGFVHSLPV